jgi:hypothetical protein
MTLQKAILEYKSTNAGQLPQICYNKKTKEYLVTIYFSREYCMKKGMAVLTKEFINKQIENLKVAS